MGPGDDLGGPDATLIQIFFMNIHTPLTMSTRSMKSQCVCGKLEVDCWVSEKTA